MIDYRLHAQDYLQFPFVSPYGIRHYQRGDTLNKVIGVIELFPILGPIVSVIEGVVVHILDEMQGNLRLRQEGWKNKLMGVIQVIPLIGSLAYRIDRLIERKTAIKPANLPVEDTEKWMKEFKSNVLGKKTFEQTDLSLNEAQTAELVQVLQDLDNPRSKSHKAVLYASQIDWVFSINSIPGRIFKVYHSIRDNNSYTLEKRLESNAKAREIIEKEGLNLLHVPEQKLVKVQVNNCTVYVLIEECFDVLHGYNHQKGVFQNAYADPELKPFMRECTRQLILFIIRTGFSDVKYDNHPLLTNGRGMGLVDLDTSDYPVSGLRWGRCLGDDGILNYLSVEEIEHFEPLLKKELSEEHFKLLKLEKLKEYLKEREAKALEFRSFLAKKKVTTCRELVDITGWNPFADSRLTKLEETVNEQALSRLGFNPVTDRVYFTKETFNPEMLDDLKNRGRIFDWYDFKKINSNMPGTLIWA